MLEAIQLDAYHTFVTHIRNSKTKQTYCFDLAKYKAYCQVDGYDQLLYDGNIIQIQSIMSDFILHCQNTEGWSSAYVSHIKSAIKLFYKMNDITGINWRKVSRVTTEFKRVADDRPYTIEEIVRMLQKADHRSRIIVLLLASSGMRQGAIHNLKKAHLESISNVYKITVYRNTS